MNRKINSVAVLGGGTMGAGIAGLCAQHNCRVLLLDISQAAAESALERIRTGRPPAVDDPEKAANITLGTLDGDLDRIRDYDWICEAVIEDLAAKRALFERLEPLRKDGSVVSTNTSGIPLHAITEGLPERLRRDIAVTHFFNPVKIMRLMELVPGADTRPDTIATLADFCGQTLGKGVVHAKDTVNFIGNRIGCFWLLSGLHKAKVALDAGLSMERIDALMGSPVGLPSTGLYGLFDLIGLDVMKLVGDNLAANLPAGDAGHGFTRFPEAEQAMRTLLRWAGDDPEREGLLDTPGRVVRAYRQWFRGYEEDPVAMLQRTFEEVEGYDEMVVLRDIRFESFCEHHLAPIIGVAHVGYIPTDRVVGISKLVRLVDAYAKRLQVQEKMTAQIANTLMTVLKPEGVAVVMEGEHHCMSTRGVNKHGVSMVTSTMLGAFREDHRTRKEFMDIIGNPTNRMG